MKTTQKNLSRVKLEKRGKVKEIILRVKNGFAFGSEYEK